MANENGKKIAGLVLDWTVTTLARGVAKGWESILGDARDAVESKRKAAQEWREREVDGWVGPGPDETGKRRSA